jgi:hypothetical protein
MVILAGAVALFVVPNIIAATNTNTTGAAKVQPMTMVLGMPLFMLMPLLVRQVKSQIAHPRALLTPNFFPAHLVTLGGILLTLLVIYPLIIAGCTDFAPLGVVALSVAIAAPAVWGAHLSRWSWMLASLGVFYTSMTDWGMHWWIIDASSHSAALVLILIIGVGIFGAWMWRLCQLREEMDEYLQPNTQWQAWRCAGGEVSDQRRIVAQQVQRNKLTTWVSDFWLSGAGPFHADDPMRIARLLRFGFAAVPAEMQALFMALMFLGVSIFLTQISYQRDHGQESFPGTLWFLVQMSLMMPCVWAGQSFVLRQPRMGMELVRPLTRNQYFDGLLAASAWNTALAWLILNIALAIAVLGIVGTAVTLPIAGMFTLLSISITLVTFGVAVRTARWKSLALRMIVVMPAWMLLAAPMVGWWLGRDSLGDWLFIGIALALVALAVFLVSSARRAWMNAEFA